VSTNIAPACKPCNRLKGNLEFPELMEKITSIYHNFINEYSCKKIDEEMELKVNKVITHIKKS